jgi:hypothetical protein
MSRGDVSKKPTAFEDRLQLLARDHFKPIKSRLAHVGADEDIDPFGLRFDPSVKVVGCCAGYLVKPLSQYVGS